MKDLHSMTVQSLIDLLAEETEILTKLISEKNISGEDFAATKEKIKQLQAEIDARKKLDGHVTLPNHSDV